MAIYGAFIAAKAFELKKYSLIPSYILQDWIQHAEDLADQVIEETIRMNKDESSKPEPPEWG